MSRDQAKKKSQESFHEAPPGAITGPAQRSAQGDPEASGHLLAIVGPELRRLAEHHLATQPESRMTPDQIAALTVSSLESSADFDLGSREDFFAFADREAAKIVALAAEGHDDEVIVGLLLTKRMPFRQSVVGQAIRQIEEINSEHAHLLRSHHVLDLKNAEDFAKLSGRDAPHTSQWKTAGALLSEKCREIEAQAQARVAPSRLDSPEKGSYSEDASLVLPALTEDSEQIPAPDLVETLRVQNADLTARLKAAEERIAELKAQVAADGPDTLEIRQDVADLLELGFGTVSLDDVPIYTGTSNIDEIWRHLKTHYGQWLEHFDADHDSISRMEVEQHDPNFVKKAQESLSKQRGKERRESGKPRTPTLGQILPRKSDLGDLTLAGKTVEDLFDPTHRDLAALVCGRLRRLLYNQ